jgi:DNA invertase Pin-like site-specific DNA recombinase
LRSGLSSKETVYIVEIARLSRSTNDLLEIVEAIKTAGASLKTMNDSWLDTTCNNPLNEFLLTILGSTDGETNKIEFK